MRAAILGVLLCLPITGCAVKQPPAAARALAPVSDVACETAGTHLFACELEGVLFCFCIHEDLTAHIVMPPQYVLDDFNTLHLGEEEDP